MTTTSQLHAILDRLSTIRADFDAVRTLHIELETRVTALELDAIAAIADAPGHTVACACGTPVLVAADELEAGTPARCTTCTSR